MICPGIKSGGSPGPASQDSVTDATDEVGELTACYGDLNRIDHVNR